MMQAVEEFNFYVLRFPQVQTCPLDIRTGHKVERNKQCYEVPESNAYILWLHFNPKGANAQKRTDRLREIQRQGETK